MTGAKDLIATFRNGGFLNLVTEVWHRSDDELAALEDLALELHERKDIDLLAVAGELKHGSGHQFHVVADFYTDILPRLEADPRAMLDLVRHLDREGGEVRDGAFIIPAFRSWCDDEEKTRGVIAALDPEDARDALFLRPALEGLAAASPDAALEQALDLLASGPAPARASAIEALGSISSGERSRSSRSIVALQDVVAEHGDHAALAVRVAIEIHARSSRQDEGKVMGIIAAAKAAEPSDLHFHAATALWLQWDKVSDPILDQLLDMAKAIRAEEAGAVNMLARAIHQIARARVDLALAIAEALLAAEGGGAEIGQLQGLDHLLLHDHRALFDDLAVRWLVSGDPGLARAVMRMVASTFGSPIIFQPNLHGLGLNSLELGYLARKSVGYLFHAPVSAASLLMAIMRLGNDEATAEATDLLVDPLLLNYSSGLGEHLRGLAANAADPATPHVADALKRHDEYIAGLALAGRIKALEPSERERFIDLRLRQLEMEQSYKEAEKGSIFAQIATPVHLLHGARVVSYFRDHDGTERRMVNEHQTIGHSTEIPRMGVVDPAGIDHQLRRWRAERPPT